MLENFGTLGLYIALAIVFPLILIGLPLVLRYSGVIPQRPSKVKQDTYECGMMPFRSAWTQFNFHYYTFAILFVVLDIMSVFLFPWAASFKAWGDIPVIGQDLQIHGFYAVVVFIFILLIGFLYAWRKKALEWK